MDSRSDRCRWWRVAVAAGRCGVGPRPRDRRHPNEVQRSTPHLSAGPTAATRIGEGRTASLCKGRGQTDKVCGLLTDSLWTAMGEPWTGQVSGAAVSTHLGRRRLRLLRPILLSVDLSYWLPNPARFPAKRPPWRAGPSITFKRPHAWLAAKRLHSVRDVPAPRTRSPRASV